MEDVKPQEDVKKAIIYALASVLAFSLMGVCIKYLSNFNYPTIQIVFFRCFFGFVPILYLLHANKSWNTLITTNVSGHLSRSLIGFLSMILAFWSYAFLPLADATLLGFVSPIVLTMLSVPLLGEKVGVYRWAAIIIGFIGVVIMIQPGGVKEEMQYIGIAIGLNAAILAALAMIIVKKLGETESSISIVFYFTLLSTISAGIALPFYWQAPESAMIWVLFIASGVTGGLGQIFTTRSYQFASAAIISPFSYASILFAVIFGMMFFAEIPTVAMLIGALIVVGSGLFILYREVINKKEPTRLNPMSMQPARPTEADEDLINEMETGQKTLDLKKTSDT